MAGFIIDGFQIIDVEKCQAGQLCVTLSKRYGAGKFAEEGADIVHQHFDGDTNFLRSALRLEFSQRKWLALLLRPVQWSGFVGWRIASSRARRLPGPETES